MNAAALFRIRVRKRGAVAMWVIDVSFLTRNGKPWSVRARRALGQFRATWRIIFLENGARLILWAGLSAPGMGAYTWPACHPR